MGIHINLYWLCVGVLDVPMWSLRENVCAQELVITLVIRDTWFPDGDAW